MQGLLITVPPDTEHCVQSTQNSSSTHLINAANIGTDLTGRIPEVGATRLTEPGLGARVRHRARYAPRFLQQEEELLQHKYEIYRKYDPGCSSRIRILIFHPSRNPAPGVEKSTDPGSGSATLFIVCSKKY